MIKRAKHSPKDNAGQKSLVESTILTGITPKIDPKIFLLTFGSNASGLLQMLRAKGSTTMAPPYLTEKLSKAVKCAMR